jgi:hypothetical protein
VSAVPLLLSWPRLAWDCNPNNLASAQIGFSNPLSSTRSWQAGFLFLGDLSWEPHPTFAPQR